jgi:hypothetical protein
MPEKPVIFFTNLFGWSTRNFFQTGVMDELTRHFRVVVLASPNMKAGLERLGFNKKVEIVEHRPGPEPWLWRMFRQARKKLYVESRHSVTEATFEKYRPRPFYMRAGSAAFKALTRIIPAITMYGWLEQIDYAINRDHSMRELFDRYKPKFLFLTHATHYGDEIIFRNALSAGVPIVYMVLSWDHLATAKILLARKLDRILVWNEHSRREVLETYPKINAEKVHVVGIPQYDFYAEKPSLSYADWCHCYGLDPAKRTIVFSTMPQVRHDQQHIILEQLLKWLHAPENADLRMQLLVKTHPFDAFPGYAEVGKKYPMGMHRTSLPSDVKKEEWTPDADEIQAGRDCLYFCSININIFSTVTIEAAYFDKPIVHIGFDPLPVKGRVPCRELYTWEHFSHLMEKNATTLVENYAELFAAIRDYAAHPEKKRAERKAIVAAYIGKPVGTAASEVAKNLASFARELPARN